MSEGHEQFGRSPTLGFTRKAKPGFFACLIQAIPQDEFLHLQRTYCGYSKLEGRSRFEDFYTWNEGHTG
jgi:hypothetical protein